MVKKIIGMISMFFVIGLAANGGRVSAESGVAINASNFPDSSFRNYVKSFDANGDGVLSSSERKKVTSINVPGYKLSSIKGIEYFTELTGLDCSYNYITELDLSNNRKLKSVRADNNKFSTANVSTLTELEYINLGGYSVETVDLSNNRKLMWAALGANIKSIDLSYNTELKTLTLGGSISELDLTYNTKLRSIYIGKTNIKRLDVSNCTELVSLDVRTCEHLDLIIIPQYAVLVDKYDGKNLNISKWNNETIHRANEPYANMWIDGYWYGADGSQTYDGVMSWKSDSRGWWLEDTYGWYPVSCWQMVDYRWYYFDESGYMCADEYREGYHLNSSGSVTHNNYYYWVYDDGWKYKRDGTDDNPDVYLRSEWAKIDGLWYYFDSNRHMVTNQYIDGYWIGEDGVCW